MNFPKILGKRTVHPYFAGSLAHNCQHRFSTSCHQRPLLSESPETIFTVFHPVASATVSQFPGKQAPCGGGGTLNPDPDLCLWQNVVEFFVFHVME